MLREFQIEFHRDECVVDTIHYSIVANDAPIVDELTRQFWDLLQKRHDGDTNRYLLVSEPELFGGSGDTEFRDQK